MGKSILVVERTAPVTRGEAVKRRKRPKGRLTQEDWIRAAMEALLIEGPSGLRIARLAQRVGATQGSFYWHFRGREEMRDRLLQYWIQQMILAAAAVVETAGRGREQIEALPEILATSGLPDYDAAMRRWALEDPIVAKAVSDADEVRIRRMAGMLEAAGLDGERAEQRAKLLMWTFRGSAGVDTNERLRAFQDLIEGLLHDVVSRSP